MLYIPALYGSHAPFYPWGSYFKRSPSSTSFGGVRRYWLWVILVVPSIGPLIYIVVEVIPDLGLLRDTFQGFPRRKRIRHLEAMITQNPSAGNLEELADLYLDERNFKRARRVLRSRHCVALKVRRCVLSARNYGGRACRLCRGPAGSRIHRLTGSQVRFLPGHGIARSRLRATGQAEKAEACFEEATQISTLSETYLNYAQFLVAQQRTSEAREWAQRVLQKKPTMPSYLQSSRTAVVPQGERFIEASAGPR